jgi:putative oxidoreductase
MESLTRYGAVAGHVLVAILFLHESWFKITHWDLTITYMAHYGLPAFLLPGALAVELLGGLALVSGIGRRYAEYVLALFCAGTALVFHMNWADANQLQHFEKDLALAGALLVMAISQRAEARLPAPFREA